MTRESASFGNPVVRKAGRTSGKTVAAGIVKQLLSLLVALNFAFLVLVAVSGDLSERTWICALVMRLPVVPMLLPTLLVALVCLIFRQVWLAAFHIGGFVMAALVMVPYGPPKLAFGASAPPKSVRVMTYNVGGGDVQKVAEAIRAQNPEVFCLQDVPTRFESLDGLDGYSLHRDGSMVIGSRLEEIDFKTHELPHAPSTKPVQDLIVRWGDVKVRVLNVRMTELAPETLTNLPMAEVQAKVEANAAVQADQMETVLRLVPGFPPLICGDFGQPARGDNYRRLRKVCLDTFAEAGEGLGLTFPATLPLDRSDFVFMAYGWKAQRAWIPREECSLHRPLLAEVYPFLPFE